MRKWIPVVLVAAVVIIATVVYTYQVNRSEIVTKLIWEKAGGIAGISEELVVEVNGSASYHSNRFEDTNIMLDKGVVKDLMNRADFFTVDKVYNPKHGVADYFTYSLTLYTSSGSKTITWVDEWASEQALPKELSNIQSNIENIVLQAREIHSSGTA